MINDKEMILSEGLSYKVTLYIIAQWLINEDECVLQDGSALKSIVDLVLNRN